MSENSALSQRETQELDQDGCLALTGVVSDLQLQAMRCRLDQLLAVTPQEHAGTMIVNGLLNEPAFDAAWQHPRILAGAERVLGPSYRLLGVFCRGLRPGHGQQALHTDWGGQGEPGVWYVCHAICALVDFTAENGATRVVPGSHRNPWMLRGHHDLRRPHPQQRQLLGKAGTVFLLNVHCQHSAVHNAAADPRLAIFASFSRRDSPLLVQTPIADPAPEVLTRHPDAVRRILIQEPDNVPEY